MKLAFDSVISPLVVTTITSSGRNAAEMATAANANADIMKFATDGFTNAAMAKVGTSALEPRQLGYLVEGDVIVPHKDELLHVALSQARAMADAGWRPPARATFPYGKDPLDSNIRLAPTFATQQAVKDAVAAFAVCVRLASARQQLQ